MPRAVSADADAVASYLRARARARAVLPRLLARSSSQACARPLSATTTFRSCSATTCARCTCAMAFPAMKRACPTTMCATTPAFPSALVRRRRICLSVARTRAAPHAIAGCASAVAPRDDERRRVLDRCGDLFAHGPGQVHWPARRILARAGDWCPERFRHPRGRCQVLCTPGRAPDRRRLYAARSAVRLGSLASSHHGSLAYPVPRSCCRPRPRRDRLFHAQLHAHRAVLCPRPHRRRDGVRRRRWRAPLAKTAARVLRQTGRAGARMDRARGPADPQLRHSAVRLALDMLGHARGVPCGPRGRRDDVPRLDVG